MFPQSVGKKKDAHFQSHSCETLWTSLSCEIVYFISDLPKQYAIWNSTVKKQDISQKKN